MEDTRSEQANQTWPRRQLRSVYRRVAAGLVVAAMATATFGVSTATAADDAAAPGEPITTDSSTGVGAIERRVSVVGSGALDELRADSCR